MNTMTRHVPLRGLASAPWDISVAYLLSLLLVLVFAFSGAVYFFREKTCHDHAWINLEQGFDFQEAVQATLETASPSYHEACLSCAHHSSTPLAQIEDDMLTNIDSHQLCVDTPLADSFGLISNTVPLLNAQSSCVDEACSTHLDEPPSYEELMVFRRSDNACS